MKKYIFIILLCCLIGVGVKAITSSEVDGGDSHSIRLPTQETTFYANNRFWVFYQDEVDDFAYKTSTDGLSWSSKNLLYNGSSYFAAMFDIYFDGTNVHYIRNDNRTGAGYPGLFYRKGVPEADGSITWAAVEQEILDSDVYTYVADISLTVDSNGYPWAGYGFFGGTGKDYEPYIITSDTNDGTWSTKSGYPLNIDNTDYTLIKVVAQTSGKLYALIVQYYPSESEDLIYGYQYDGAAWGSKDTVSSSTLKMGASGGTYAQYDLLAESDELHLVFHAGTTDDIRYINYNGTDWVSEEILVVTADRSDRSSPVLTYWDSDTLYMFWTKQPNILWIQQYSDTWYTDEEIYLTDQQIVFDNERCLQSFKAQYGSYGGVFYLQEDGFFEDQIFTSHQGFDAPVTPSADDPINHIFKGTIIFNDNIIIKN